VKRRKLENGDHIYFKAIMSKKQNHPHLVFGYGSLICPDSRAITAPTVANRSVIPVTVQNMERTWTTRTKGRDNRGMTAVGIRFLPGAECGGVLLLVTDEELDQFDTREICYDRFEVPTKDIEPVPFLGSHHYENTFLDKEVNVKPPKIWVYVARKRHPAVPDYPIAQTYVDIILRGCLTISEEFAHEFIATTKGWNPSDFMEDASHESEAVEKDLDNNNDVDAWVDDRRDPIYIRADSEYSLAEANDLDSLLWQHFKDDLQTRRRRYKRFNTI
jgi:cation transport regulator ChaC